MEKKIQSILTIALPAICIFGFLIWGLIKPDEEYSLTERRVLAEAPRITGESIINGSFMEDFETYSLDQFPARDELRTIKAITSTYIFGKMDNHGLYKADGYLSKLEYPMNEARIDTSIANLNTVYEKYLKDTDCNIYMAIIPDKNYYLAKDNGYPIMDYDYYFEKTKDGLSFAKPIDIKDEITLESFYYTDQHIRQEYMPSIAEKLGNEMGVPVDMTFTSNKLNVPFYGAYYSQAALPGKPDEIYYLTNETINNCIVTSYNTGKPKTAHVYDMEKASGKDPYEMFLSGPDALMVIENPNATSKRELVIFRDSFASSLTPLLMSGYSKITLVDLRYIRTDVIGLFVDFTNQDVLILYSTLVL